MPEPRRPTLSALNSWKEIAVYMGRGVRTVQRWERDLGLPVHRIGSGPRRPACAFPSELDAWLRRTSVRKNSPQRDGQVGRSAGQLQRAPSVAISRVLMQRSRELTRQMVNASFVHRSQTEALAQAFARMRELLEKNRGLLAQYKEYKESMGQETVKLKRRGARG